MTLQDWGALGELIGGAAIIVSLIYVAFQIRQSTHATRSATSQAFIDGYIAVISPLHEPSFAEIYWRGLPGLDNLQGSDKVRFVAYIAMILRAFESYYIQEKDGVFDSRLFGPWSITFIDLFANHGAREVLEIRKHQFNAQFIEFLQGRLEKVAPKDMYSIVDT
jgi:hypothetical protein